MSEAGAVIVVVVGVVLIVGGLKGTLLQGAHALDTAIPGPHLTIPGEKAQAVSPQASPAPGAPGSGVTTQ